MLTQIKIVHGPYEDLQRQEVSRGLVFPVSQGHPAASCSSGGQQQAVARYLAPCARQVIPRSDRFPQPQALMAFKRLQKLPKATKVQSVRRWQLASLSTSSNGQFSATAMTPTSVKDSQPDRSSSCAVVKTLPSTACAKRQRMGSGVNVNLLSSGIWDLMNGLKHLLNSFKQNHRFPGILPLILVLLSCRVNLFLDLFFSGSELQARSVQIDRSYLKVSAGLLAKGNQCIAGQQLTSAEICTLQIREDDCSPPDYLVDLHNTSSKLAKLQNAESSCRLHSQASH